MGKRRGNGEGSFRQRGKTWQYSLMVGYYPDGRKKVKTFSARTQAECRKLARDYLNDLDAGISPDSDYTFSQYAEIFMGIHSQDIKPVTIENYRYTLRHLNEYFANKRINKIKPLDVDLFLQKQRELGRSDSSIAQCRGLLYMILAHAEGNGFIRRNPVRYAKKMRKRLPNEKECFTIEEIRLLMKDLPQDRAGWSGRILLASGIRTQELLALRPDHIAPDGSYLTIRQAISMVKGTATISTPKSYDSYRTVYLPECVWYCAVALRNTDADYIWSVGDPSKPCNPSTFRKEYRRAIESVPGVRYLPPHNCRHTFVSMLQRIVDLSTIQAIVGHSTLRMTQHYLHVHPTVQQEAAAKFSALLSEDNNDDENPSST